jgi:hypothetical protein
MPSTNFRERKYTQKGGGRKEVVAFQKKEQYLRFKNELCIVGPHKIVDTFEECHE